MAGDRYRRSTGLKDEPGLSSCLGCSLAMSWPQLCPLWIFFYSFGEQRSVVSAKTCQSGCWGTGTGMGRREGDDHGVHLPLNLLKSQKPMCRHAGTVEGFWARLMVSVALEVTCRKESPSPLLCSQPECAARGSSVGLIFFPPKSFFFQL